MMQITTKRLLLRQLNEADCTKRYLSWLNDKQINQYLETRHNEQNIASIKQFVALVNERENEHLFGIFIKENNSHIGNIKVGPIGSYHPTADISLFIGARESWGNGYASEAIEALSKMALNELGIKKLSASMYAPNMGSCKAFEKAGYKREGLRRKHYLLNGELCDVIELGITIEDLK